MTYGSQRSRQKAVFTDTKIAERQEPQWFIPKLKGKKVIIRLASGGQPVTGIIEGYNPYEILLQMQRTVRCLQACYR
jgi:hypothetical protein